MILYWFCIVLLASYQISRSGGSGNQYERVKKYNAECTESLCAFDEYCCGQETCCKFDCTDITCGRGKYCCDKDTCCEFQCTEPICSLDQYCCGQETCCDFDCADITCGREEYCCDKSTCCEFQCTETSCREDEYCCWDNECCADDNESQISHNQSGDWIARQWPSVILPIVCIVLIIGAGVAVYFKDKSMSKGERLPLMPQEGDSNVNTSGAGPNVEGKDGATQGQTEQSADGSAQ